MPLITFEGVDGAGKTSAIAAVAEQLSADGHSVLVISDFNSCPLARMLKPQMIGEPNAWAQYALVMAARVITHRVAVEAALAAGSIVLYDRYVDSTHAYQGSLGVDHSRIAQDHHQCGLPAADLTLVLDLPIEVARVRKGIPADRMEALHDSFFQVVRTAFLSRALDTCQRQVVINAGSEKDAVAASCLHAIKLLIVGTEAQQPARGATL